jgi:hypothetical protein
VEEQEQHERRHVVTRKRSRTQQRGSDTQREGEYQQRPGAAVTGRKNKTQKRGEGGPTTQEVTRGFSGSADQRWMVLPRRSRGQTRATRGVNDRPQRAIGVSRALACCVGTPVVAHRRFNTCPPPVIHPVRVRK